MIPFNKPLFLGEELTFLTEKFENNFLHISGNGEFTKSCEKFLEERCGFAKVFLTNSCTSALEMCALILKSRCKSQVPEVIMPSYTFVSTANSFAKFGFRIKFVDVKPDSMNIDESLVLAAITPNTAAIIAVNYGGISSDLNILRQVCDRHQIFLIEDAAQSIDANFDNKPLGSFGDLATISFHETKNITSAGEGGCLIINNPEFIEDSQIVREKGTNRSKFLLGLVDKYSWFSIGGHYMMSEISAAFLFYQLQKLAEVKATRLEIWNFYKSELLELEKAGIIDVQNIPQRNEHNAHIFWIKTKTMEQRSQLITFLMQQNILAVFHYIPLHSTKIGKQFGEFVGDDIYTTSHSERILRLPIFHSLRESECRKVTTNIKEFFKKFST